MIRRVEGGGVPAVVASRQDCAVLAGRPMNDVAVAVDAIWTLTAPEIADRLVRRCGWSLDDYETWLANAMISGFRARH